MIFESINYWFAFQDFVFSIGAGFAVGFFYQIISVFLYKGKTAVFIKDILTCFVFAVVVFSYVVSFTNYPIIRIYHIIGGFLGFCAFPFKFSTYFHKIFEKFLNFVINNILCYGKKVSSIICEQRQKRREKHKKRREPTEDEH